MTLSTTDRLARHELRCEGVEDSNSHISTHAQALTVAALEQHHISVGPTRALYFRNPFDIC